MTYVWPTPCGVNLIRVGQGFDVHRLIDGDGLVLGGVFIECPYAVVAHSDGDVLLHAIMDALLGALALGDIGQHFPDTDPAYRGADSRQLLRHTANLIAKQGFSIGNLDCTVIAEVPKVGPHRQRIQQQIADDLGLDANQVSVKATTTEKLGFTGRKEGIAAQVIVLLDG